MADIKNLYTIFNEKKVGREHVALPIFTELSASRNPWRALAFAELAKYYEHRERNYAMALEMTLSALGIEESGQLVAAERCQMGRQAGTRSPVQLLP